MGVKAHLKSQGTKLGLVLFGVLLALVLLELWLSLVIKTNDQFRVSYKTLFLEPHPQVGWTHVPSFTYRWTGLCREFDETHRTNSYGLLDKEWTTEKPPNTVRIAVLGDSYIDAVQVPREQTAVYRLQERLNSDPNKPKDIVFETMNFGVSNYGVGQMQLMYEHIARQFDVDYVIAYIAYFHMERTVNPYTKHVNLYTVESDDIRARPTYKLSEDGDLVFVPAEEYETYVERVRLAIDTVYGEDRMVKVSGDEPAWWKQLRLVRVLRNPRLLTQVFFPHPAPQTVPVDMAAQPVQQTFFSKSDEFPALELNYRILEKLQQQVSEDGAQLVFLDVFAYFAQYASVPNSGTLVANNRAFAAAHDMGYFDGSQAFFAQTEPLYFPCDIHLTPFGNQVLGDAMYQWFVANTPYFKS